MDNKEKTEELISEKRKELEKLYVCIRNADTPEEKSYFSLKADQTYAELKNLKITKKSSL